jgi:hypothetical protein
MKRSRTYRLGVVVALALLAAASAAHAQPCAPDGASSPCLGGRGIRYCVNGAWGECRIETCESFSGTTLSDGPAVTAEDLAQFDRKWGGDHAGRSCLARQRLAERCDPCVWEIFDRMHANSGGLHGVSVGDSALYAHAMAAFARIVLENPAPLGPYLGDAVRHANAVIETVYAFLPDIAYRERGGQVEAYLLSGLPSYRTPTPQQCSDAYAEELERIKREVARAEWPEAEGRARSMLNNCRTAPRIGPLQHNINLSFAMVLIELSRALESPSYRQSPQRSNDAEPARVLAPVLVARLHRYFVNNLHTVTDAPGRSRFVWNFSDDVPAGIHTHPEDASHGALDMRYVELIARDRDRLSRLAAAAAPGESISFDETYLRRFANTFLQKLVQGRHLAHDVTGRPADPIDQWDGMCDGWVVPAAADPEVYEVCREMTLRAAFRNPGCVQPNLNMSNHAALLAHKRFATRPSPPPPPPPVEVPDVVGLTPNRAGAMLRQAGLVPRFTPGGTSVRSQAPRAGAFVPRGTEVRCVTQREPVQ